MIKRKVANLLQILANPFRPVRIRKRWNSLRSDGRTENTRV